jgi:hypothetical protein
MLEKLTERFMYKSCAPARLGLRTPYKVKEFATVSKCLTVILPETCR